MAVPLIFPLSSGHIRLDLKVKTWICLVEVLDSGIHNQLYLRINLGLGISNAKKPSCFCPIPQAADYLLRVIERADAPVIYLSTDAAESETGLLQSLVVLNGRPVPLVICPARNPAEKWDAMLYRHGIEGD